MGIDLSSGDSTFRDLIRHRGHKIVCTDYGFGRGRARVPWNASLECETCGEVLLDADAPESTGPVPEAPAGANKCDVCGKEFENYRQLNGHMGAHRPGAA